MIHSQSLSSQSSLPPYDPNLTASDNVEYIITWQLAAFRGESEIFGQYIQVFRIRGQQNLPLASLKPSWYP